jgi:hypothetical protein
VKENAAGVRPGETQTVVSEAAMHAVMKRQRGDTKTTLSPVDLHRDASQAIAVVRVAVSPMLVALRVISLTSADP